MTTAAKGADGARKQAGSPVDAAQKKPPQPRAWQGTNPITQRPSNANSNGVANTSRPSQAPAPLSGESASPVKHLSDRMYYLLANLSGLPGNITLKNGEKYTGVLSGTSLDPTELRYVFKMVKKVQAAGDTVVNGTAEASDDYIGAGDNYVMSFDMSDVADFHVNNVILDKTLSKGQNGVSSFRTDTDISGNMAVRERTLQKWEPASDANANLSLESSGQAAGWDQFAVNERLFGVRSDYDENIYTTTIDRSHPQYAERAALAEKKAREIEASSALNAHVTEERAENAATDREGDEEDLYSGVYRPLAAGGPNTYTPPARRAPTSQPTVKGAPVDPAIISSQLARPDPTAATTAQRTTSPSVEKRATPEPTKSDAVPKPTVPAPTKAELPKEDTPKTETKPAGSAHSVVFNQMQKPGSALKPIAGVPTRKPGRPENATANVEHDLLDSFKQFSAAEKLRMSERQRNIARESKAVKLNDLKKFSQNFKLNTPVPSDLVPILAKDEGKQQLIVQKALKAVEELKVTPPKTVATMDLKSAPRPTNVKPEVTQPPQNTTSDRQQNQRTRPGQNQYGSQSMRNGGHNQNMNQGAPRHQGLLGPRLQMNQQQHKQQGGAPYNGVPQPIPNLPPTGPSASPSGSGIQTPMSNQSRGFSAKAPEFKPNPAAGSFIPGGSPSTHSSPRPESVSKPDPPRKVQITSFFSSQRPSKKTMDLTESFNPITRLTKDAAQDSQKARQYQNNGGIQPPYHTPPTWVFPEAHNEKGYIDMFERPTSAPVSAPHNPMGNGQIPHQHQLPPQFQGPQGAHQGPTPHQTPRNLPVQPQHGHGAHHFDSQHMQFSHSNPPMQQSPGPRHMPPYMYGQQPQPMGYPQQMQMQPFMNPSVQHVPMRGGGAHGPQFVTPPGPAIGAQMMTNQHSNGPYMNMPGNPQMPMYSGAPGHGYPQYPAQMQAGPGANGFSPRVSGAPLMAHQNSQQGHQPQHLMYMQPGAQGPPMFGPVPPGQMAPMRGPYPQPHQPPYSSPHQQHQFPQQHRGTPSGSYAQPMMPQHSLPPQVPPTGPANHGPEEEVK
ncbi:PAB1 binding protein-like protein [Massarina eburnea CBS 473.64]|uniref:PAB1 binding protein-like protein n=1 Tax=Massarina eburnea CBS 473.64 TaxID=1395130 RepID=A0A6A6RKV6_9PLEO|nr:PAB1 binding protein-like protein [Massarina eburnea CBS 473.64]